MKKKIFLLTIFALIFLLSACGSGGNSEVSQETNENQLESGPGAGQPNFEMPLNTALIIGIFQLEGTDNAVTSEQAADLLPLWQVMKSLLESDTAAAAEIDALTNQIANMMTDSQMSAIEAMELSPQDLMPLMEEFGLNIGIERPEGVEVGEGGFQPPEGFDPGFGPGGGTGGRPGGNTEFSPEELEAFRGTREAGGGQGFGGGINRSNSVLIEALIALLQSK